MAQKYPRKQRVEIAILDTGMGVYESLKPVYHADSPLKAIEHTLLPGVSRALDQYSEDMWANSGFGLYVLSQLGRELGDFEICSSGILQSYAGSGISSRELHFAGTGIRLFVSYADSGYFPNLLKSIVATGEEDAYRRTGVRHRASMSTLGLWD